MVMRMMRSAENGLGSDMVPRGYSDWVEEGDDILVFELGLRLLRFE